MRRDSSDVEDVEEHRGEQGDGLDEAPRAQRPIARRIGGEIEVEGWNGDGNDVHCVKRDHELGEGEALGLGAILVDVVNERGVVLGRLTRSLRCWICRIG